jgi:DNA-binding winged helix-turn-helix (wHTH) protein
VNTETLVIHNTNASPALSAFDALRAEVEPWLEACFVPPPDFDLIAGARSVLVFGERGSGKTALYRMLLHRLRPPGRRPDRLVVEWQPALQPPATPADSPVAEIVLDHVLTTCMAELSRHVTSWPDEFNAAPEDVRDTLTWFAQEYQADTVVVDTPSNRPVQDDSIEQLESQYRIAELVKALTAIGLSGVCVLVGPGNLGDLDTIQHGLRALLSSLTLVGEPRFVYKLVLPASLGRSLLTTGGVERRRLDPIPLRWLEPELLAIVERRLALATGGKASQLSDVCEDRKLYEWLARYGGDAPRGWLEQIRPVVAHYLSREKRLTTEEWEDIRRHRPPRLTVDLEAERVIVGWREIENLGQVEMALLRYLYQNRGRVCSREELYHSAYVLSLYPEQAAQRAFPQEYAGLLDTALWRLRKAIEPDPKNPIFVITRRGRGVELKNAW